MIMRDYKQERRTAIARGETGVGHMSGDAIRHRARRLEEKRLGHKLPTSVQVDHKMPLKKGGNPAGHNLRLLPASVNMSKGGKSGNRSGKAEGGRKAHRMLPVTRPKH